MILQHEYEIQQQHKVYFFQNWPAAPAFFGVLCDFAVLGDLGGYPLQQIFW